MHSVAIADLVDRRMVSTIETNKLVWHPIEDSLCYTEFGKPAGSSPGSTALAVVRLPAGERLSVAKGQEGHVLMPIDWTLDRGIIYGDSDEQGQTEYRDLSGKPYNPVALSDPLPTDVPSTVGVVLSSRSARKQTGNLLFTARRDGIVWIWLYQPNSGKYRRLVPGTDPIWRPE